MIRMLQVIGLLLALVLVSTAGAGEAEPAEALSTELENALAEDPPPVRPPSLERLEELPTQGGLSDEAWLLRRYLVEEVTTPLKRDEAGMTGLPIDFSEDRDYLIEVGESLWGWESLALTVELPEGLPAATDIYLYVKDWDDLWLHVRHPLTAGELAAGRLELQVPLAGAAAERLWTPRGHHRSWHQLLADRLKELGLKFALRDGATSDFAGEARVSDIRLSRSAEGAPRQRVSDLQRLPEVPKVGQMVELSFRLNQRFLKPFDRADVDLRATVVMPGGESFRTRVFYREDFVYDNERRRTRLLVPYGAPRFSARFTPARPGEYQVEVAGEIGGEAVTLPPIRIEVLPPTQPWLGYVQVSPHDDRLLVHSADNSEFWGIGMNMRSPYDTRYAQSFPFTRWDETDFEVYEELLPKYAAAGINVIEVWMSPWWLALEWIPDAPGNHGLGHMNQWRAWKIDRLMKLAEKHGIYVILVINNHGKFSAWIDSDWDRNPFNSRHGGPLETPMEYFSDPVAKAAFRRLADYMVARWGYSPNLLAWKLFTEIDLTGNNREWYKDPSVREWHAFAADYLHEIDPNRHLVTTHWATSYQMVNRDLAMLPQLDMVTLDIYYNGTGAKHLFDFMFSTAKFVESLDKPGFITEFGGSPHGDTLPHILHQLHMALWAGWFTKFPVTPCFWWYPLVEEKNLYSTYANVAAFTRGESRSGAEAVNSSVGLGLQLCELRQEESRMLWLLDTRHYFGGSLTVAPRVHKDVDLVLRGMQPGTYAVEWWDCQTGMQMQEVRWEVTEDDRATLEVPVFQRDIAAKIRRVGD